MRFVITTAVLNGEAFLDETILSVVSQSGPFSIRYHVQDGGSTDRTLAMLAEWKLRLEGGFAFGCKSLEFTFASARDSGVYEGVKRGFEACGSGDAMAWINADDRFMPGAFATVATVFERYPSIQWITGRHMIITEGGETQYISPLIPYPREALAAGIFDGRFAKAFVQQEGTFWRTALWRKAGGVDPAFRLAGDLDLWRRFAQHADLVMVDAPLGSFRVRPGQLSTSREHYYAEIDASLTPAERKRRSSTARAYRWAAFRYFVVVRKLGGPWESESRPMWLYLFERIWLGLLWRGTRLGLMLWRFFAGRKGARTPEIEAPSG